MALSTAEITRIRYELGYNVLAAGASGYVSVVEIFNQVVQTYCSAGATTTSATAVVAATTPTPVALTLASATGFAAGDRVWVDVDDRQETATVQSLAGAVATLLLSKAHSGTYPVTVDGGEGVVREILAKIKAVSDAQGDVGLTSAGLKQVDEIQFYGSEKGSAVMVELNAQREHWRRELASALGVTYLREARRGSAGTLSELY